MLVKIKEISVKMHFCMPPQTCGPLLQNLHTTYRLPFWPKFSPPKVSRQ